MSKGFIFLEQGLHWSDISITPSCTAVGLTPILADWITAVLQLNYDILKIYFVQRFSVICRN